MAWQCVFNIYFLFLGLYDFVLLLVSNGFKTNSPYYAITGSCTQEYFINNNIYCLYILVVLLKAFTHIFIIDLLCDLIPMIFMWVRQVIMILWVVKRLACCHGVASGRGRPSSGLKERAEKWSFIAWRKLWSVSLAKRIPFWSFWTLVQGYGHQFMTIFLFTYIVLSLKMAISELRSLW